MRLCSGQLGEQFAGRMRIAVGIEHDWYYPVRHREAFDYIIGSVHEIQSPDTGKRYIIDGPASYAEACRDEAFGGDGLAMAGVSTRSQRKMPSSTVRTSSDILTLL